MEKYALLKIKTDNTVDLIEFDSPEVSMEFLHTVCDPYEFVRSGIYADVLICLDDEGKMDHKRYPVNFIATAVYANPIDVIVGDVFIGTDFNPDPYAEPDFYCLSIERAKYLRDVFTSIARAHDSARGDCRR